LGNEELLAELFPAKQILGGLCFVCLNRIKPGVIQHLDHGQIVLSEFCGRAKQRTRKIASAFQFAGVPCKVSDCLARAHWEKLVWNIPFNGLGVAASAGIQRFSSAGRRTGIQAGECLTTEGLLRDAEWTQKVKALMLEVIATARALGFKMPRRLAEQQIQRTRSMGPYRASTLIDFQRGQPIELNSLFLEPLRLARSRKVPVPNLERLCRILREIDPGRTQRSKHRAVRESSPLLR
jgi:2-dehydropantoate 2-reductase